MEYTTFNDYALTLSPIAYYKLDETSGTTLIDSSGNSNDGVIVGIVTFEEPSLLVNDSNNKSIKFIQANTTSATSNAYLDVRSLSFIGKTPSPLNNRTIFSAVTATTGHTGPSIRFKVSSGKLSITLHNNTGGNNGSDFSYISTNFTIPDDVPVHYALTWDGSKTHVYADAVIVASSNTNAFTFGSGDKKVTIGASTYNGAPTWNVSATVDEVLIFNDALTEEEILKLYAFARIEKVNYVSYNELILSPLLNYDIQETTGSVLAESISSNDGVYGSTLSSSGDTTVKGHDSLIPSLPSSKSVQMGSPGFSMATLPNTLGLGGTISLSVAITVKMLDISGTSNETIFTLYNNYFYLRFNQNSKQFKVGALAHTTFFLTPNVANGDIFNIVVVYDHTIPKLHLWVDGVKAGSSASAAVLNFNDGQNSSLDDNKIGNSNWATTSKNKDYAFLRIYDRALTDSEISTLYVGTQLDLATLHVAPTSFYGFRGEIIETLLVDSWFIRAYGLDDGLQVANMTSPVGVFDLVLPPDLNKALNIVVAPNQGDVWVANTSIALDEMHYPTDPVTTPYYFKCTTAGTTGPSEPSWNIIGTTTDNGVIWTVHDYLVHPKSHAPIFPATYQLEAP